MEFRLLGLLEVRVDGQAIALGGPKQRAFLERTIREREARR
jgi:hypothetical protein